MNSSGKRPISKTPGQVLVVDDEAGMRAALEVSFARRGWRVETAAGKADALARFRQRRHSLVVTDVRMADGDGFSVMREVREIRSQTAVILLTGFGSVAGAVEAMKSGACEYLTKPVAFDELLESAERIVTRNSETGSAARAEQKISCESEMIGSSPALRLALERARQAAASDADILIEAESGTGKELLARMIHSRSARRDQPFVAINCAGLPESLLENELFGHGRGAFTGAFTAQPGKFEIADGGTLLLDEIGEMPLTLQPKLLRALQEREFYRLGEAREVKVDLRVIATTNRELSAMVREGSFRADLYYRLNVIPLNLPPLRERQEDIPELAQHFARQFQGDSGPTELSDAFIKKLGQHSWPGNIRELANVIRRTIALSGENTELLADIASPRIRQPQPQTALTRLHPGMSLESMQRRLLEMTLRATAGNRSHAAEMLGISLRTVRNKIREYHLPPRRQYAHGNVDVNFNSND